MADCLLDAKEVAARLNVPESWVRAETRAPDIVAVRDERVVFIELKAENGRLREEQARWLAALGMAGQEAHCWRPSDWPTIEEALR